jgi:hypothetical protein
MIMGRFFYVLWQIILDFNTKILQTLTFCGIKCYWPSLIIRLEAISNDLNVSNRLDAPPSLYEDVREHLKEWLDAGAIRESNSPSSSNVVLVRKSDGSLRMCIDFRTRKGVRLNDCLHGISSVNLISCSTSVVSQ